MAFSATGGLKHMDTYSDRLGEMKAERRERGGDAQGHVHFEVHCGNACFRFLEHYGSSTLKRQ